MNHQHRYSEDPYVPLDLAFIGSPGNRWEMLEMLKIYTWDHENDKDKDLFAVFN